MLKTLSALKKTWRIRKIVLPGGSVSGKNLLDTTDFRLFGCVATATAAGEKEIDESLMQETDFNKILEILGNDDEKLIGLLNRINSRYKFCKERGRRVPAALTLKNYRNILSESSLSLSKYFNYLYVTELKEKSDLRKKQERAAIREERHQMILMEAEDPQAKYGLWRNAIHQRRSNHYMRHSLNYNLMAAHQFSQKIILDCSYNSFMNMQASNNCVVQIINLLNINKVHINPFHIMLCNVNRDEHMGKRLLQAMPRMYDKDFLAADVTDKSYLDLFPKEKLVYLSPHAKEYLTEYNDDDIYIIGAYVDKGHHIPTSLTIAKRENMRCAAFPIDKYLHWRNGSKSLTLNAVMQIMLDQRQFRNWEISFRHVPSRCTNPYYINVSKAKARARRKANANANANANLSVN